MAAHLEIEAREDKECGAGRWAGGGRGGGEKTPQRFTLPSLLRA